MKSYIFAKLFSAIICLAYSIVPILGAGSLKESAPFAIGVGISDRIPQQPMDWPLLKTQFN